MAFRSRFAQAEHLEKLNKAYDKRTAAVAWFQEQMGIVRKQVNGTVHSQRGQAYQDWNTASQAAARTRNPEEEKQLKEEAKAAMAEVEAYDALIAKNEERKTELLQEFYARLAAIDKEIASLGGVLNVKAEVPNAS